MHFISYFYYGQYQIRDACNFDPELAKWWDSIKHRINHLPVYDAYASYYVDYEEDPIMIQDDPDEVNDLNDVDQFKYGSLGLMELKDPNSYSLSWYFDGV